MLNPPDIMFLMEVIVTRQLSSTVSSLSSLFGILAFVS